MENFLSILLLVSFFGMLLLPMFVQLFFGIGIIHFPKRVKFWHICVVSVILWIVTYYLNAQIITYRLKKSGSHDGMPYVGLLVMEVGVAFVLVVTILVQVLVRFSNNLKKKY